MSFDDFSGKNRSKTKKKEDKSAQRKRLLDDMINERIQSDPVVREYVETKEAQATVNRRGDGVEFDGAYKKRRYITPAEEQKARAKEGLRKEAASRAAAAQLLLREESGFILAEDEEEDGVTADLAQNKLKHMVDIQTKDKIFNLELNESYIHKYSRNGVYSLLGARSGNFALFEWKKNELACERNVNDKIHAIEFLHNHQMFAFAQSEYAYIYDLRGIEQHKLRSVRQPRALEYLPYHFLLASIGLSTFLCYHDVSIGKSVASFHASTGGDCHTMRANPTNGIIHTGSFKGRISLFSPNVHKPLVELHAHHGDVVGIEFSRDGNLFVTAGGDGIVNVYDARKFEKLNSFVSPGVSSIAISQTGLLAIAHGKKISVRKNFHDNELYMTHNIPLGGVAHSLSFCPYEDVLGIGHSTGFESIVIPGSGEANIDSYVNNPYQTKQQRREQTVQDLLKKIPMDQIVLTLDENQFASLRPDLSDSSFTPHKSEKQLKEEAKSLKRKERRKSQNLEVEPAKVDLMQVNNTNDDVEKKIIMPRDFKNKKRDEKIKAKKKVSEHEKHRMNMEKKRLKEHKLSAAVAEEEKLKARTAMESENYVVDALDRFKKSKS